MIIMDTKNFYNCWRDFLQSFCSLLFLILNMINLFDSLASWMINLMLLCRHLFFFVGLILRTYCFFLISRAFFFNTWSHCLTNLLQRRLLRSSTIPFSHSQMHKYGTCLKIIPELTPGFSYLILHPFTIFFLQAIKRQWKSGLQLHPQIPRVTNTRHN